MLQTLHTFLILFLLMDLVLLLTDLVLLVAAAAAAAKTIAHPILFQFGDSLSDTGNAQIADFTHVELPYGMTFFNKSTGRFCDGRLVIDFLALRLQVPLLEPYAAKRTSPARGKELTSMDFATAGATALSRSFYKKHNMSLLQRTYRLGQQLEMFLEFRKRWLLDGAASFSAATYIVGEIGGNDYHTMYLNGVLPSRMLEFVPTVVNRIMRHIQDLRQVGARRFVVINIPLQGCNPVYTDGAQQHERDSFGCVAALNDVNIYHNALLKDMVTSLRADDITISYGDFAAVFRRVLAHPATYDFVADPLQSCCRSNQAIAGAWCCKDPSAHVYWDNFHFTDHFYSVVADAFLSSDAAFMDPPLSWDGTSLQASLLPA